MSRWIFSKSWIISPLDVRNSYCMLLLPFLPDDSRNHGWVRQREPRKEPRAVNFATKRTLCLDNSCSRRVKRYIDKWNEWGFYEPASVLPLGEQGRRISGVLASLGMADIFFKKNAIRITKARRTSGSKHALKSMHATTRSRRRVETFERDDLLTRSINPQPRESHK